MENRMEKLETFFEILEGNFEQLEAKAINSINAMQDQVEAQAEVQSQH